MKQSSQKKIPHRNTGIIILSTKRIIKLISKMKKRSITTMKKKINFIKKLNNLKLIINSKTKIINICIHKSQTIIKIKLIKANTIIPKIKEIAASHIIIKSIKHKTQSTKKSTNYNQLSSDNLNSFTIAKTTDL